jgi:hypothetical protein
MLKERSGRVLFTWKQHLCSYERGGLICEASGARLHIPPKDAQKRNPKHGNKKGPLRHTKKGTCTCKTEASPRARNPRWAPGSQPQRCGSSPAISRLDFSSFFSIVHIYPHETPARQGTGIYMMRPGRLCSQPRAWSCLI